MKYEPGKCKIFLIIQGKQITLTCDELRERKEECLSEYRKECHRFGGSDRFEYYAKNFGRCNCEKSTSFTFCGAKEYPYISDVIPEGFLKNPKKDCQMDTEGTGSAQYKS